MPTRRVLRALILMLLAACTDASNNPSCGDGDQAATEQCDDGNTSNGDGCSSTCRTEVVSMCGNGEINVATETCDDGNTMGGDGCSSMCQNECGNGMLDGTEACDDGNLVAADGCNGMCLVEDGYTCTGEPSDCIKPTGACSDPFSVTFTSNAGTLSGTGMGDTSMSTDQVTEALCDGFMSGGGKDHIWQFTLTETRDVTVEIDAASAFDSTLRLLRIACDVTSEVTEAAGEDGCSDSGIGQQAETLRYSALSAGTYFIVIDAYDSTEAGTYTFHVTADATKCGNGMLDGVEICDDSNTTNNDGCSSQCDVEPGYACTGEPSVCGSACGNGALDMGEECDDDNTTGGDRCSPTCTLESDIAEVEAPTAQVVTASNHIIRGSLTAGDEDLYTFTLAAPATVELEIYNSIDNLPDYNGVGTITNIDCVNGLDTELRVFNPTGDVTMDATALAVDDEDGDNSCSYLGPNDSGDGDPPNPMQGVLPAGTYTIKVNLYFSTSTATRYALDLKMSSTSPVAPVPGDLVLNEVMAGDNMSDTNCDGAVTGTNDEFVELVNVSGKMLDLTGVSIADSVITRHVFAAGPTGSMTLAPGKAIVVWTGGTPACAAATNWFVASTGQLGLNDAGDTITVSDANMVQLLQLTYPAATLNVSSNRSPEVVGTTYALHTAVTGAVGAFSPGTRANGTAF
jgi:cysteine-rich repeat protein